MQTLKCRSSSYIDLMGRVIGDGQPIKKQAKDNIIMHKRTIEVITGEKAEGILDGREFYVTCPQCNSVRFVYLEYEGEWFTCANCGTSYSVTI
jgi:hypothetical protein